jgi:GAF domain
MTDYFAAALGQLDRAPDPPLAFCKVFSKVLPVSGAAVSTLGEVMGSETLAASDAQAARLDELQFDLGEGPCWDAMTTGKPVLQSDLAQTGRSRWPSFSESLVSEGVSSVFAFPLGVGPLRFGAIDLYSTEHVRLNDTQADQASAMADVVSRHVLRRAIASMGVDSDEGATGFSRRLIHQATGMVLAQIDVSAEDALLVIEGHAFAGGRPMMEVAQEIIGGKLRFSRRGGRIEVDR